MCTIEECPGSYGCKSECECEFCGRGDLGAPLSVYAALPRSREGVECVKVKGGALSGI